MKQIERAFTIAELDDGNFIVIINRPGHDIHRSIPMSQIDALNYLSLMISGGWITINEETEILEAV